MHRMSYHFVLALIVSGPIATSAAVVNIVIVKPETCGNANGEMYAYLSGTQVFFPLSYSWSNGATTPTVTGLAAGTYSVTITDGQGTEFNGSTILDNLPSLPVGQMLPSYSSTYDVLGFTGGACTGQCNGTISMPMVAAGGTGPFTFDFSVPNSFVGMDNSGFPIFTGFCAGAPVDYTVTDALGCQGMGSFNVVTIDESQVPSVSPTQGACDDADIGSISIYPNTETARFRLTNDLGVPLLDTIVIEPWPITMGGLPYGQYVLQSWPLLGQCEFMQYPVIPDLGPGCAQVEGTSWYDLDADCVFDPNEVGVSGSVLVIEPGPHYAITVNGQFSFALPAGNYTLAQANPYLDPYCPAAMPVPFTVNGPVASIELANSSTEPLDLRVHASCTNARPGFSHTVFATAFNHSPQTTGVVTVTGTIDPNVTFVNATPTPDDVIGNTLTWIIPELDYFGAQGFVVQTFVPVGLALGTLLTHTFNGSTSEPDGELSNNTASTTRVVAASYDPNEKTARTSSGWSDELYYIDEDERIDYTIRFQNTGSAEALFVTVTDTLPEELDMTTFEMGIASHAYSYSFKPGRVVEWRFDGINLPDSTSDEAGSHGFITFRIEPVLPLIAGTVIENTANIYFDNNPPVITEPSVLTAEFSTDVAGIRPSAWSISPNPAAELITLRTAEGRSPAAIDLVSYEGRVIRVPMRRTDTAIELDIRSLAPGIYLIRTPEGQARFAKH